MKKLYALLFLAVSATFPLFSQSGSDHHPKWVDYTGTHEVDVSVGFPTARIMVSIMEMGRGFMWLNNLAGDILDDIEGNPPANRVNAASSGDICAVPNLRAEYGYNILSWLNLGLAVNYSNCSNPMQDMDTGMYLWTENSHMTSVTVKVRFYWLNRKWVRMYSSLGAGVGVFNTNMMSYDLEDSQSYVTSAFFAPDVCLVGLTVGRKVYGRIEWGSIFGGLTAGIGCRF